MASPMFTALIRSTANVPGERRLSPKLGRLTTGFMRERGLHPQNLMMLPHRRRLMPKRLLPATSYPPTQAKRFCFLIFSNANSLCPSNVELLIRQSSLMFSPRSLPNLYQTK
jgi:hypothetical protein